MTKTTEAINTVGLRASDMAGQPPFVQHIGYVYMKDWAVNTDQIIDKSLRKQTKENTKAEKQTKEVKFDENLEDHEP